ncbi:MAG: hypothetical protein NT167_26310 [Verrucomicrobia bacterium]|nr:hypothetical protein [Verrucomicrobiota bacterium]
MISGLKLNNRVLVRRTDFGSASGEAVLTVNGQELRVPVAKGRCQILDLK